MSGIERANLIMKQQGLPFCARQETGGRGNCFFLAIVDQLSNNEINKAISSRGRSIAHNHKSIREQLVWFMRLNQEFYTDDDVDVWLSVEKANEDEAIDKGRKEGPKRSKEKIWNDYLKRMSQVGEWANEILIKAAAWFFEIDILVVKENTKYPMYGTPIRAEEHIREPHMAVLFLDGCHFQSVHKVKSGGGNIKPTLRSDLRSTKESVSSDSLPCRGCGSKVRQINKHLAQKPQCRIHYSEDELNTVSLNMRRASRKNYNVAHQAEISKKKAETYKATQEKIAQRPEAHNKAGLHENDKKILAQSRSNLEASICEKVPKDGSDGHCYTCHTVFETISDAKRHAKEVHGTQKFKCPSCDVTFTRRDNLTRHVATVHDKSARQLCTLCDVEFANTDSFVRHVHNVHEEEKKYECPDCPLNFARKDTLDKHLIRARVDFRRHGGEKECTRCHKTVIFPSLTAYYKHMKETKKEEWWHKCKKEDACADALDAQRAWAVDAGDDNKGSWGTDNNVDAEDAWGVDRHA